MTVNELIALAPHLPPGTEIQISFQIADGSAQERLLAPKELAAPVALAQDGEATLKIPAAARRSGIPQRELRRALKDGFLPFSEKADGRDAGAHLVTAEQLGTYADQRRAIAEFREDPPAGWPGPGGAS